jgi:hypothetical protein
MFWGVDSRESYSADVACLAFYLGRIRIYGPRRIFSIFTCMNLQLALEAQYLLATEAWIPDLSH